MRCGNGLRLRPRISGPSLSSTARRQRHGAVKHGRVRGADAARQTEKEDVDEEEEKAQRARQSPPTCGVLRCWPLQCATKTAGGCSDHARGGLAIVQSTAGV